APLLQKRSSHHNRRPPNRRLLSHPPPLHHLSLAAFPPRIHLHPYRLRLPLLLPRNSLLHRRLLPLHLLPRTVPDRPSSLRHVRYPLRPPRLLHKPPNPQPQIAQLAPPTPTPHPPPRPLLFLLQRRWLQPWLRAEPKHGFQLGPYNRRPLDGTRLLQ